MPLQCTRLLPHQSFTGPKGEFLTTSCTWNDRCWLLHWGRSGCRKGATDSRHYFGQLCQGQASSCLAVNFHRGPLPPLHALILACMHHYLIEVPFTRSTAINIVWGSVSKQDLHHDATRDLRALGCHINIINNCQELDRETKVFGLSKDMQEGVLFM